MAHRLSPLELRTKLISFPTVSRDTNLPLVDWVEDYLDSHGIAAHHVIHNRHADTIPHAVAYTFTYSAAYAFPYARRPNHPGHLSAVGRQRLSFAAGAG